MGKTGCQWLFMINHIRNPCEIGFEDSDQDTGSDYVAIGSGKIAFASDVLINEELTKCGLLKQMHPEFRKGIKLFRLNQSLHLEFSP